jgi:hypothetical protein
MESTLVLKLVLVPILIGLVSVGERRWGPTISGWLIGLPLTAAPAVLILALDQGVSFAAKASQGTMLGYIAHGAFCLAYSWLSFRCKWLSTLLLGWSVFFAATVALDNVSVHLIPCFIAVVGFLALNLKLFPKVVQEASRRKASSCQILIRMVAGAAIVLLITGVAPWLGPQLSGLLTTLPIYASVLAVSTHRLKGANSAAQLLRGVVVGSLTAVMFFLVVAGVIETLGIFPAFALATVISLAIHGCLFKTLVEPARFRSK